MSLKDRLRDDMLAARRERDRERLSVLTTTVSELRNREIELGRDAGDDDVIEIVHRAIKRRREASEQMRGGGRPELADREDAEAELLAVYLPAALSEDEVRALARDVVAAGADNVGAAMSQLMPKLKGRFDGREANRIVREELER